MERDRKGDDDSWNIGAGAVMLKLLVFSLLGTSVDKVCLHAGTCEDTGKTHRCLCQRGYMGSYCEKEVDECLSNPCRNGATCTDYQGGYGCTVRTSPGQESHLWKY